jgi:hypothetical protein
MRVVRSSSVLSLFKDLTMKRRRSVVKRRGRGEEADNVGEGSNEEDEAKLEHVPRQTQRSHVVAPPIAPAREEDLRPIVRVVIPVTISTR